MKSKWMIAFLSLPFLLHGCGDAGSGFTGPSISNDFDPIAEDVPIAYVKRPLPRNDVDDDPEMGVAEFDVLDPAAFNPGAQLIFKVRAAANAPETIITDGIFPNPDPENPDANDLYDVKDLSVNAEGDKIVFSMRAPADPSVGEDQQPTWNIWEYDISEEMLRRVILSDLLAESGDDISPAYLPDGTIIFSSNRQVRSRAVLLDESKPAFSALTEDGEMEAFLLHTIDEDGIIEQVSYNQSHDLYPSVMDSGEVVFLRWDNRSNANSDRLSLYKVNPDGSNLTLLYGFNSQNTGTNNTEATFYRPVELPDGRILVSLRPRATDRLGGDMVAIDTENFVDNLQPTFISSGAATAQESLSTGDVIIDGSAPSPHGIFSSAYPLYDNTGRLLVSWNLCTVQGVSLGVFVNENNELVNDLGNLIDTSQNPVQSPILADPENIIALPCTANTINTPTIPESEPRFGLWVYDPISETQGVVLFAEQDTMFTDAVVIIQRQFPTQIIPPNRTDPDIAAAVDGNVGILHIRSVYDFDGTDSTVGGIATIADPALTSPLARPAHFIRVTKAVSVPDDDLFDLDFGLANGQPGRDLKDIIGYAPIHPDGSVKVRVPADIAFTLSILDSEGKRLTNDLGAVRRHWLSVRPGEVKECNGCHTDGSQAPHGRIDAEQPSINAGAPGGAHFSNSVLRDDFGTAFDPPLAGQTMAEYFYMQRAIADPNSPDLSLSVDIVFEDVWTDEQAGLMKAPAFAFRYGVPDQNGFTLPGELTTLAPVLFQSCLSEWAARCRTTISYPDHIQPLWETPRTAMVNGVEEDVTCVNCHAEVDVNGAAQVPAPENGRQIDLTAQLIDGDDFILSYEELFTNDQLILELNDQGILIPEQIQLVVDGVPQFVQEQLVVDGVPQFEQEQLLINGVPQFEADDGMGNIIAAPIDTPLTLILDAGGSPIPFMIQTLDVDGNPIPILVFALDDNGEMIPVLVNSNRTANSLLNGNSARANQEFFNLFGQGAAHEGYLSPVELKLLSEWLDIGGQYYNNPFDTLDDD